MKKQANEYVVTMLSGAQYIVLDKEDIFTEYFHYPLVELVELVGDGDTRTNYVFMNGINTTITTTDNGRKIHINVLNIETFELLRTVELDD